MSFSKLESLPNEILIDILQTYVNGVDILVAFLSRLNTRFDGLIAQCQRFHFDFKEVRKDDFLTCIGLLPHYVDQIRTLRLSEWHTPGEINIFLSSFLSFDQFKHLRVLHFHVDAGNIAYNRVKVAIHSLSSTSIHSLSIVLENQRPTWHRYEPQRLIGVAFSISTSKRLSFDCGFLTLYPDVFRSFSTNVEYLNLQNTSVYWVDLKMILSCARSLKYLNVRLTNEASSPRRIYGLSMGLYYRMIALRTFIIHFSDPYATGFHLLIQCFHVMSKLTRLEVSSDTKYIGADIWEQVITSSLPLLTDFLLLISRLDLKEDQILDIFTPFQTPFWIAKRNFNVIITTAITEYQFRRLLDKSLDKQRNPLEMRNSWVVDPSIVQLWSAPRRSPTDNVFNIINTTNLSLSTDSVPSLYEHYFNNVTTLNVTHLNRSLVDWMMAYINLSRIVDVNVWNCDFDSDAITSLLSRTTNINSLRISFNVLTSKQTAIITKCDGVSSQL